MRVALIARFYFLCFSMASMIEVILPEGEKGTLVECYSRSTEAMASD